MASESPCASPDSSIRRIRPRSPLPAARSPGRSLTAHANTSYHATSSFAGYKFVPPGPHLLVYSLTPSGPSALPFRSALFKHWAPKARHALSFDAASEGATLRSGEVPEAELRELDPKLAAYPFGGLEGWKALAGVIGADVLEKVVGEGVVDSMTQVEGERDEVEEAAVAGVAGRKRRREGEGGEGVGGGDGKGGEEGVTDGDGKVGTEQGDTGKDAGGEENPAQVAKHTGDTRIRLPVFDLRRSWPDGATGDDITRWSQDKSKLWQRVATEQGGESRSGEASLTSGPAALLGQVAIAFLLVTQVWNHPSLGAYKRLVSLFCRSHAAMAEPELFGYPAASAASGSAKGGAGGSGGAGGGARETTLAFVTLLTAQIGSLPDSAFATELPDLDVFYLDEIEHLRRGLGAALAVRGWWGMAGRAQAAWNRLAGVCAKRGWKVGELAQGDEEEDEDEEGEYAPVVVEM